MIIARVNNTNEAEIAEWEANSFSNEMYLDIISENLTYVKDMFSNIELLQIINNETIVAEFTAFNSYENITFLGDKYINRLNAFRPILRVTLTKVNLVEQVQRLDKKVNNYVDIDAMTIEEYRAYILKRISDDCQADIYAGAHVLLDDGTNPNFSYTAQDQQDLKALCDTALQIPQFNYSWHADGELCKLFTSSEIVRIYATLQMKLLYATTYCNALNQLVRSAQGKSEIGNYYYGYELSSEAQQGVNNIVNAMRSVFEAMINKINPVDSEDDGNSTDNGNSEDDGNAPDDASDDDSVVDDE